MAEIELNSRLQLRHDSTENWDGSTLQLKAGEAAVEFTSGGKAKLKVATEDGQAFAAAPYIGGEEANVFQVTLAKDETDVEAAINAVVGTTEISAGDIAIVRATIYTDTTDTANNKYSYTGYVYDGTKWKAMDGNYNAKNVYFDDEFIYTVAIGTLAAPSGGSAKTVNMAAGKSVQQFMSALMAKKQDAAVVASPNVTITSTNAKAYEVGTPVAVNFSFNTNSGSYKYTPVNTGITFNNYSATFNGQTVTGQKTGSFDAVTVGDTTALQITGSCSQVAGSTIPCDNLGNPDPSKKIPAKEWTGLSYGVKLTGFRNWFYGYKTAGNKIDVAALDSAKIRALTAQNGGFPAQLTTNGMQQMFFAIPKGKKTSVTVANAVNGAPCTVTKVTDIMVEGANGYAATAYDVWYVNNAAADGGSNKYAITVK